MDEAEIAQACRVLVSRVLNRPPTEIALDESFARLGLDSANFVSVLMGLEEQLGIELDDDLMVAHPTIARLAAHLAVR